MTEDERAEIVAAGRAAGAAAPPFTPAQLDYLNALFRPAMRAVLDDLDDER